MESRDLGTVITAYVKSVRSSLDTLRLLGMPAFRSIIRHTRILLTLYHIRRIIASIDFEILIKNETPPFGGVSYEKDSCV